MKKMKFMYNEAKIFLNFLQIRCIFKENKFLIFCNITEARLVWELKCVLLDLGIYSKTIKSPHLYRLFNSRKFFFLKGEVLII